MLLVNIFLLGNNSAFGASSLIFPNHLYQGQLILFTIISNNFIFFLSILGFILFSYFYFRKNSHFLENKTSTISKENIKNINSAKLKFFTDIDIGYSTPINLVIDPTKQNYSNQNLPLDLKKLVNIIEEKENQIAAIREIDSDNQTIDTQNFSLIESDLGNFIKNIIQTFKTYTLKKEINFVIETSPNTLVTWHDPTITEQVVIKLLTNISNYKKKDSNIIVKITLKTDELVVLELFPEDQANSTKEKPKRGFREVYANLFSPEKDNLKLYLSKKLIRLPKGAIELYSQVTIQNHFELLMPVGRASYGLPALQIEPLATVSSSHFEKSTLEDIAQPTNLDRKNTLLVVDDSSEIRRFIKEIFDEDFQIFTAENGVIGYEQATQHIPDIIITDVMMPEMTGFELTAKLKTNEQTNHIPLILLTALDDFQSQKTGYEEGGDVYISKPFSPQLLKLQVNNLIKTKQKKATYLEDQLVPEPAIEIKEATDTNNGISNDPTTLAESEFLQTINDYLEIHYASTELNVHALAKETFMSYIQFYRKFKGMTGINAKEYIRTFRLKKAAHFFKNDSEKSVTEVMHKVGFSGQSYFSASFKKQFGVTPSEFKARNN